MLDETLIDVAWNGANKKHYQELGYEFTKLGDIFKIKPQELGKYSRKKVNVICDYCGKEFMQSFCDREKCLGQQPLHKDSCKECKKEKRKEICQIKYGQTHPRTDEVKGKYEQTMMDKYGVKNSGCIDGMVERIKNTCMEKYGVTSPAKLQETKDKISKTCMERYGVKNYVLSDVIIELSKGRCGDKHYEWKGDDYDRSPRGTKEYKEWRKLVLERDNYTCVKCGDSDSVINTHHIENYSTNEDLRLNVNNGACLCEACHKKFHMKYGYRNNSKEQLKEYLDGN